jgi:predicted nuclease of restriction endonuclease-like (RecB) superfamily
MGQPKIPDKMNQIGQNKGLTPIVLSQKSTGDYGRLVSEISGLLEQARRTTVRVVNNILTPTYWEIGHRIVEYEQGGKGRAEYGEALLRRLADDLSGRLGRGFSQQGLYKMRGFYLGWRIFPTPSGKLEARVILPTPSGKSGIKEQQTPSAKLEAMVKRQTPSAELPGLKSPTLSGKSEIMPTPSAKSKPWSIPGVFPLPWSHYVRLISVESPLARAFYESEAIRGGWSVRQLDRQIGTQFYERTAHSKNQDLMLARGQKAKPEDKVSLEDEVRDPYLLEFLNLKDEYSESELEEAIVRHLEWFLLELGAGFAFVARQKRIRIGDEWYRIDLLLFHRKLKCLVVIDLKIGKFTHADAGQMNLYLNYARENMMESNENKPVGLILCSAKNDTVVHYAMGGIKAKVFASHYLTNLPDPETLRREILKTERAIRARLKMVEKAKS